MQLPKGVSVHVNRPEMKEEVEVFIGRTLGASGVLVASCGPNSLNADARAAVAGIDRHLKRRVGGVESHAE